MAQTWPDTRDGEGCSKLLKNVKIICRKLSEPNVLERLRGKAIFIKDFGKPSQVDVRGMSIS
jgi:hypothetical protein